MMNQNIISMNKQEKEASFFDEIAEGFLTLSKEDQMSLLFVDVEVALSNYPDYYQYAYSLLGDIKGKRILDMGCGSGKSSVILAKKGAFVIAFDISEKYVEVTALRASLNGVEDKIKVERMAAENVREDSESFDFAFGVGILHHLDFKLGIAEIARVLKSGGQGIFIEPIAFSPTLRRLRNLALVRKVVPNIGKELLITEDERQLYEEDLEFLKKNFKVAKCKSFQLLSRLDRVIGGYPVRRGERLINWINGFDRILLDRFGFLSQFGRWGVIQVIK